MTVKIAHITEAWAGGIATYINTLIHNQVQSDDFSEVSLIYSSNRSPANMSDLFANFPKVKTYSYESSRNPLKFYPISKEIKTMLSRIKPDIIHLHSTFPGVYGRLLKLPYKIIYCSHCWSFAQERRPLEKKVYTLIERFLAKRTSAIINISRHEEKLANILKVKSPYINTFIYTGVRDVQLSSHSPNLPIDPTKINIGFVGRLDKDKGFDIIENFFRSTPLDHIKLYAIGEAEKDASFKKITHPNIHYLGWIDNKDIDNYIQLFDAIIIPSRWEGFAFSPLEAMRNGKPVIVSNKSSLPESVIHSFNGYIFNLDDADNELSKLVTTLNKETLKAMGNNARRIYESCFTEKKFIEKLNKLYFTIK